ncbi:transcriptional regulator [Streptomyces sp. NPDC001780]
MPSRPASFAALYALSRVAADAADHWIQTHRQAVTKAEPGPAGRRACAAHVASYVGTQAAAVGAGAWLLGIRITPGRAATALAISAVTHYVADRRTPVRRLAEAIGKTGFYELGGPLGGAYLLDQGVHHAAEAVAVAVLAGGTPRG